MNTQMQNKILLLALYGFATVCFASCSVFTLDLLKIQPMIPIGYILLTIILLVLFIRQLYKLKWFQKNLKSFWPL